MRIRHARSIGMEIVIIVAVVAAVVIAGHIWGTVPGAIDAEWLRRG